MRTAEVARRVGIQDATDLTRAYCRILDTNENRIEDTPSRGRRIENYRQQLLTVFEREHGEGSMDNVRNLYIDEKTSNTLSRLLSEDKRQDIFETNAILMGYELRKVGSNFEDLNYFALTITLSANAGGVIDVGNEPGGLIKAIDTVENLLSIGWAQA